MKNFFKKSLSLCAVALFLFSMTGCNGFLYENSVKSGIESEFAAVKAATTSEELPDSQIVNTIAKEISFPGITMDESQKKSLVQALLKNFDASVEHVSLNTQAGTGTVTCKMSNTNMEAVATSYAENASNFTDEELVAMTWGGKTASEKDFLSIYLETLSNADLTNKMQSELTILLSFKEGQWVSSFSGDLSTGFYNAVLGGYSGSLEAVQEPLVLASYNALFNKLSGITPEEFAEGNYMDHPIMTFMKESLTDEINDELLTKFSVSLLKNFSGTADSVSFNKNEAFLNCTFTNGNMIIAMNQSDEIIEKANTTLDEYVYDYINGKITYEQLESLYDEILANIYTQYFQAIENIPETDFIIQESIVQLERDGEQWIPDVDAIEEDYGLFNAMFGNLLDTSNSSGDSYSPIYSS